MFHLGHFWVTDWGKLCSDQDASPVTDRDECLAAFSNVQVQSIYPSEKTELIEVSYSVMPKGCSINKGSTKFRFYWNQHLTGGPSEDYTQICYEKSK